MPRSVFAARVPRTALLTRDGTPVWPVRDEAELAALDKMVSTLGGQLCLVDDAVPARLDPGGAELVVGLGRAVAEDAELYAHLTGRTALVVDSLAELAAMPLPAVVVTDYQHVDEQLLDVLYEPGRAACAPGLVFCFPGDELRWQVLARAAALRLAPFSAPSRRVDVYPDLDFGAAFSPDFSLIGGQADAATFRTAFALGAGVLTLSTHSDGIDAKLRSDLVLCSVDPDSAALPGKGRPARAPACVLTATCHRMDVPIAAAAAAGRFLAPPDIRARVFVHSVCWGLFPAPDVQSPEWSLARRIMNELSVAALITSWEITAQTVATTATLFHDIARGEPLGRALAAHLASTDAQTQGHQLCLVGDPAIRLAPSADPDPLAPAIERSLAELEDKSAAPLPAGGRRSDGAARAVSAVRLLLRMVENAPGRSAPAAERLRTAARRFLAAGEPAEPYPTRAGPYPPPAPPPADELRQAAADFFTAGHTDLLKCWYQDARSVRVQPRRLPCRVCGRRTVSRIYQLNTPGAPARRHTQCPNCGPVQDVAVFRRIALVPHGDGVVRWLGYRPRRDWCARLVVEPQLEQYRASWPWPAGSDGAPQTEFRSPRPWPELPVRIALLAFWGPGEFAVSGFLTRPCGVNAC